MKAAVIGVFEGGGIKGIASLQPVSIRRFDLGYTTALHYLDHHPVGA